MIAAAKEAVIERVIVPLDSASENRTAIETAARLAASAQARLHGVFVEDEELLHLASLPFTRQMTLGATPEELTPEHVELHLRLGAERARLELMAAAKRHGVEASFEIVRGASDAALARASERDLVVAGGLTRPIGGHFRLACRWWSSIEVARGPVLLARHDWHARGAVVMLLRGHGATAARLLEAAAQVAEAAALALTVIALPGPAEAAGSEAWIADRLAGRRLPLHFERGAAEPAALRRRIAELDCRLLAVDTASDDLREIVERFGCDVLVVR